MLMNHQEFIFKGLFSRGKVSSGTVEGFNAKAKLTARKSYGFRPFEIQEIAFCHSLGDISIPDWSQEIFLGRQKTGGDRIGQWKPMGP